MYLCSRNTQLNLVRISYKLFFAQWERASVMCTLSIYEIKTQQNLVQTTHSRVFLCNEIFSVEICLCDARALLFMQPKKNRRDFLCLDHEEIFGAIKTRNP